MNVNSLEVYHQIKTSGKLSEMRDKVLETIASFNDYPIQLGLYDGMPTASQLSKRLGIQIRSVTPRLKELEDMGLIACTTKKCPISGFEANAYYLTGNTEVKPLPKKQSRLDIIRDQALEIFKLENEIVILKKLLSNYEKLEPQENL